jgi:hypothetical protein
VIRPLEQIYDSERKQNRRQRAVKSTMMTAKLTRAKVHKAFVSNTYELHSIKGRVNMVNHAVSTEEEVQVI